MFLSRYTNTSGSLGEREMLWEHEPLPNFHEPVFLYLVRNTEDMFSISFRKNRDEKKENNLLTFIIKT